MENMELIKFILPPIIGAIIGKIHNSSQKERELAIISPSSELRNLFESIKLNIVLINVAITAPL